MKRLSIILLLSIPSAVLAQFGISFHQSNLPFAGVNYEINNRFRPEVRIGTDNYFDDLSLEGVFTYDLMEREDFEVYAGIGGRLYTFEGVVVPVGVNIFPLAVKQFGFHIELTPVFSEASLLRGSWGIRYRFGNRDSRQGMTP